MDGGAWQATVHGVNKESDKTETHTLTFKGAVCLYLVQIFWCNYK